ncbi:hypothetical protein HBI46_016540 [Parastagonospora nodorum]|nr:hypothetical protein HBI46_016540 [Parastagonospora nodorum]
MNGGVDELEEEYRPTWDPQACPTCHNLRPSIRSFDPDQVVKNFCWDELLRTVEAGCKFCAVLQQGLRHFLGPEPYGSQRMKMYSIDQGPLQVHTHNTTFLEGEIEFYIHQDAPRFSPLIGVARDVSPDASKDDCMALAKAWLDNCINNHKICPSSSQQMPTRVIIVGSEGINPVLYVPEDECSSYVALSHCWGDSRIFCTKIATINQRKEGMLMESLPKTYHDAVVITRKLGIEYLWIDSLCILQDSEEVWN